MPKNALYTIQNNDGLKATIASKGAQLVSLIVPDRGGNPVDVIYGFEGIEHPCAAIDLRNVVWNAHQHQTNKLELTYSSRFMTDDYSSNFYIKLLYSLSEQNCLTITCEASSENRVLISHPSDIFFNLNGNKNSSILKHQLLIRADSYLPVSDEQKPLGYSAAVVGTPFDFRNSATIGARINDHHMQLKNGNGYCHCYLLNKHSSRTPVAKVKGDRTSIIMEVCTNQPKVLFWSGSLIQSYDTHKTANKKNCFFALSFVTSIFLETQYPAQLPVVVLKPDEDYRTVCSYLFKN